MVKYLFENDILHREIEPSNFVLTDKMNLQLIDFEVAKNIKTSDTTLFSPVGKQRSRPPEMFQCESSGYTS